MHFATSSLAATHREVAPQGKERRAPFRTAQSRRLVEEYWQSVLHSKGERPLYHTYSDRYGGTRGIPFAARTDSSVVLRGTSLDVAHAPDRETLFAWCMEASEGAMASGDVNEARACLQHALTQLQNSDGGLTVSALASTARGTSASPEGRKRAADTGEVLRRLGKVSLRCNDLSQALTFLDWSTEADPMTAETYVLRAACLERMAEPKRAFAEYEKYLKLAPPSLEVLAHCGKCAADAGDSEAAVRCLEELLRRCRVPDGETDEAALATAAFYEAHAYFYLGVVQHHRQETQAEGGAGGVCGGAEEAAAAAERYYRAAAENAAYVESYESSVDEAVECGDYDLALYQLRCLQRMVPECSSYYLRTAHVHHLCGNIDAEVDALSEALDRDQGFSTRRTTLLTRGTVYADKLGCLGRAIKDFTLVLALPPDMPDDRCTPIAYMKRAAVLRRCAAAAAAEGEDPTGEDQEAALHDYKQFLHSLAGEGTELARYDDSVTGTGAEASPSVVLGGTFPEHEICTSQSVTDALLILANGAFLKGCYDEAAHFFSRAIARGWQPQPPQPFPLTVTSNSSDGAATSSQQTPSTEAVPPPAGLYDQLYLSLAHYVMRAHPVNDDVFKVPYEPRDWTGRCAVLAGMPDHGSSGAPSSAGRKSAASVAGAKTTADRKDVERAAVASPSLSYSLVDARYNALRALEPTVHAALEDALLAVWAPYRAEVERVREEAMAAKSGKRTKRHV